MRLFGKLAARFRRARQERKTARTINEMTTNELVEELLVTRSQIRSTKGMGASTSELKKQEALWHALEKRIAVTQVPRNCIEGWKFVKGKEVSLLRARSGRKPEKLRFWAASDLRRSLISLLKAGTKRGFFFLDEAKMAEKMWNKVQRKNAGDKFPKEWRSKLQDLIPLITKP